MELNDLLFEMISSSAMDMHLVAGRQPYLRIDGVLQGHDGEAPILQRETVLELAEEFFGFELEESGEPFPLAYTNSIKRHDRRFRGTVLVNDMSASLIVRLMPKDVPPLKKLGVAPEFMKILELSRGLVVIAGASGSGKTTTLYSLADEINRRHQVCICILEDGGGIELTPAKALVHQVSYNPLDGAAEAYHHAMLTDADVIVGYIEDEHDLLAAIKCVETGHMVVVNYHAATVEVALERLADCATAFANGEVRLADALAVCVSQKLAPKKGGGRRAVLEILWCDEDVASVILGDEPLEKVAELLKRKDNLAREE